MPEYTPTTDEVRKNMAFGVAMAAYVVPEETHAGNPDWPIPGYREEAKTAFDRWLRNDREQQARFWIRVRRRDGYCWLWEGETASNGYGRCDIDGKNQPAHRVSYEWLRGPVPEGLELDHLCSVRNCVNPAHLEPVSHRENTMRGKTITSAAAAKTHCPRGHELAGENLVPSSLRKGRRDCLTCSRRRAREYRERKRSTDV